MERRSFLKFALGSSVACASGLVYAEGKDAGKPVPEENPDAVGMLYDSTLCIGCQACVYKCREVNGMEMADATDTSSRSEKLDANALNVIQIWKVGEATHKDQTEDGFAFIKRQCMHCVDPNCVTVCPVSAMKKDPVTGIVTNDPDICTGCRYCMVACPFNVPKYEYNNPFGQILKCQLCNQKGVERLDKGELPGCVEVCPTGAVIYGKRSELLVEAKRRLAAKAGDKYGYARQRLDSDDLNFATVPHYQDHLYGEFEGGGTQVLVLSGVPYENLNLPKLDKDATGSRAAHLQHHLYSGMILPAVVLGGLLLRSRKNLAKFHGHDVGDDADVEKADTNTDKGDH